MEATFALDSSLAVDATDYVYDFCCSFGRDLLPICPEVARLTLEEALEEALGASPRKTVTRAVVLGALLGLNHYSFGERAVEYF